MSDFPETPSPNIATPCLQSANGDMEFSDKVRNILKTQRRSQAELARDIGTTQQQVSRWLENNKPPSHEYLLRMARSLKVTVDYLLDPDQDEQTAEELTDEELTVLTVLRALKLDRDEAIRRLSTPVSADFVATEKTSHGVRTFIGEAKSVTTRELTESHLARQRERNRPAKRSDSDAEKKSLGVDKGSKSS